MSTTSDSGSQPVAPNSDPVGSSSSSSSDSNETAIGLALGPDIKIILKENKNKINKSKINKNKINKNKIDKHNINKKK